MRLCVLSEAKYDFCSTQFNVQERRIFQLIDRIKDEYLTEDGKEDNPHITVKYGLIDATPEKVAKVVSGFGNVSAVLGEISLFQSNDNDVIKIDIHSPKMHRLNKLLRSHFKHDNTYPVYVPHLTLAYVRPGYGKQYVGDHALINKRYTFSDLMFSDQDGNLTKIPLANIKYTERV